MKHRKQVGGRIGELAGLLLVALLLFVGVAQASGSGWSVVSSPNASANDNVLQAVAAVSTTNVWAVGYVSVGATKATQVKRPLVERFNGISWSVVSTPKVGAGETLLNGVAAISKTDIWAVGATPSGALLIHADGAAWSVVSNTFTCQLNAVAASSASNVWAVGTAAGQACALHFNGSRWTLVPTPKMGAADNALLGVTTVSATEAWAVGSFCVGNACDRGGGTFQTLILHYTGGRWGVVPSPNPSVLANRLAAVTAISTSNAWAVGYADADPSHHTALILHFDGTSWIQVAAPSPKGSASFSGIAALSGTDIYAVGAANIPTAPSFPTLIEHFDGTSWSIASSPSPGVHNALNGIAHVPGAAPGSAQFWAVGMDDRNAPSLTLTVRDI